MQLLLDMYQGEIIFDIVVTCLQVWRIAFFGRLEERKGLKLFVEAVNKLQEDYSILELEAFEVHIVGPEAVVDMVSTLTGHKQLRFASCISSVISKRRIEGELENVSLVVISAVE